MDALNSATDDLSTSQIAEEIQLDDDIAMTQPKLSTKCPYTGQEMVNPVRNKYCKHNYELDGILALIGHRGDRARCPVSGCVNDRPLLRTDMEQNEELKRIIERKKLRAGGGAARKN
jgi:SUMO ligase MMS21 Smc5/6 complex component